MEFSNYDSSLYANKQVAVSRSKIPDLLIVALAVTPDERGWSKDSYHREEMIRLGFPEAFVPVQNVVTSNEHRGVTRGIHAERINRYISVTRGLAFAAFVDLRDGPSFGVVETVLLTPAVGIYLPGGCGNSYQTLTSDVQYSYFMDAHRTDGDVLTCVNLGDPELAIRWPIPLAEARVNDWDLRQPMLADVVPVCIR